MKMSPHERKATFHLPGLFEYEELYRLFLPLFFEHRDWFYDFCRIGSLYGAPADCLWGGGRVGFGEDDFEKVLYMMEKYNISARLTFSNSLLEASHLSDPKCNSLCARLEKAGEGRNGVIVHSDLLADYIRKTYPGLYLVSSTTKVLTDFEELRREIDRPEFSCVVPDFRLNKCFDKLKTLNQDRKDKLEFLCNECCAFTCPDRKACYENVSQKALGLEGPDHICRSPHAGEGYRFSRAMKNPAFISVEDIEKLYLPMGFSQFKIEGRGLGSALILEFLLYYLTKPDHQMEVREAIYLDAMLDLF